MTEKLKEDVRSLKEKLFQLMDDVDELEETSDILTKQLTEQYLLMRDWIAILDNKSCTDELIKSVVARVELILASTEVMINQYHRSNRLT